MNTDPEEVIALIVFYTAIAVVFFTAGCIARLIL
jgi:hypothetical protein